MRNRGLRLTMRVLGAVMVLGGLAETSHAGLFGTDETPGERFRKALETIKLSCESRTLAPGEVCGEVARLKPADPLATEEGRFAHSIRIPNPVPADSGYKPGMTSQEYFDHLCKTEAGEFIYKTVENVAGLLQLRPREHPTDSELEHLYAMEDPYGHSVGVRDHAEEYFVQPAIGKYQFLEIPLPERSQAREERMYLRFYRDPTAHAGKDYQTAINGTFVRVPYVVGHVTVPSSQSRYGYTWRGVGRPHDRRLGIAGGELIILDLRTNEVLAVRRGFVRSGSMRNMTGVWWLTAQKCSKESLKTDVQFINQVLMPVLSTEERDNVSR